MGAADKPMRRVEPRLHVVVVTGDHAVFDGPARSISLPAVAGQITVLAHHAPLLAMLDPGEVIIRADQGEEILAIGGGFVEVRDDEVIVLADTAERAEEIDAARAEAAKERAKEQLKKPLAGPELIAAEAALRRSLARLKVSERKKRRGAPSQ